MTTTEEHASHEPYDAVVVMLDALGIRSDKIEVAQQFLRQRPRTLTILAEETQGESRDKRIEPVCPTRLKNFMFGDTLLLVYKTEQPGEFEKEMRTLLVALRRLLARNLDGGPRFRGSMSYGKVIADESTNTAIGPAISDAAKWYEQGDWLGLILTPRATLFLEPRLRAVKKVNPRNSSFWFATPYQVPLKSGSIPLLACNWPRAFFAKKPVIEGLGNDRDEVRQWVRTKLDSDAFRGNESKLLNTLGFFEHVLAHQKW